MKKSILVLLLSTIIFMLSCGSSEYKPDDPFIIFLIEKGYIINEDGDLSPIELPSGFKVKVGSYNTVEKDKTGDHVVLTPYCKDAEAYKWVTKCSIADRKKDMAALGDYVIEYAKSKNWDNKYDLYINIESVTGSCGVVYNYETDTLYISKYEKLWIEAYEKFGAWSIYDLEDMPEAQEWLIDNHLGQIKHGEFELFSSASLYEETDSYKVFIDDGEFKQYCLDHSDSF